MGYKKLGHRLGFSDLELQRSLKQNRSLKLMENLNAATDWSRIESVLMSYYTVGISREGAYNISKGLNIFENLTKLPK